MVRMCGALLKEAFLAPKVATVKSEAGDLVTETDKRLEQKLREGLLLLLPQAAFIGEETSGGGVELGEGATWLVDPLDGTTNFVHGNPQICIIVGLLVDGLTQFCIVINPVLSQEWTARLGHGARYNGAPMLVSGCTELGSALLVQQVNPKVSREVEEARLANLATFAPLVRGTRVSGSTGLDLAYLAMGAVDAFFHFGHHIWDYWATALLVVEAGGQVLDLAGGKLRPLARRSLAAATPQLARQVVERVRLVHLGTDG